MSDSGTSRSGTGRLFEALLRGRRAQQSVGGIQGDGAIGDERTGTLEHQSAMLEQEASTLSAQRAFDAAADSAAGVSLSERVTLAAQVREHATEWFGADADSERALQALADADEQYAQTVVAAEPAWLEATLGPEVDDPYLSAERGALAGRIAHERFGREDLADIEIELLLPAHARLLREIEEYRELIGLVEPAPGQTLERQYGMSM